MRRSRFPVVEPGESAGEAARRATRAGVGAILVRTGPTWRLLDVRTLKERGAVGPLAEARGRLLTPEQTDRGAEEDRVSLADMGGDDDATDVDRLLLESFDGPAGYKECDYEPDHIYPPSFPGTRCPTGDGGTLKLKMI